MNNKIIYPLLIIIFSVLIIYAILTKRNNDKLNNGIEKFMNNYIEKNEADLKLNAENNTMITQKFANGTWTQLSTTFDSNQKPNNLMTINLSSVIDADNIGNNGNYGTITLPSGSSGDPSTNASFNITYVLDENIIAVSTVTPVLSMHIKFLNILGDEKDININKPFYTPSTLNSIVSIFIGEIAVIKYASYKIYDDKVNGEVFRIIKSRDYLIDQPPPVYDFKAYDIIIGNYLFSPNLISLTYGNNNNEIKNTLNNFYTNNVQFSIQRVFSSPTGAEIITKNSPRKELAINKSGQIPNNIVIDPFINDKYANGLDSFFKPKATILYFYKLTNVNTTYDYANPTMVPVPSASFNFKNGGNSMYQNMIESNILNTVQQVNKNTYTMTYVTKVPSDLTSQTIIPFSSIFTLL